MGASLEFFGFGSAVLSSRCGGPGASWGELENMTEQPAIQSCPACATVLDVTGLEPLTEMECPVCSVAFRIERNYDHFRPLEKLGEGGMGSVFRALDDNLNRPVALKLLRADVSSDPAFVEKFEREARITASVNHPHVVRVFSFGREAGQYFLAMELVGGGSLDELMQLQGRVAEPQVLGVGVQIAEGLKAAYEAGLIHSDVKPGNILFADAHTAKITDFGLAKTIGSGDGGDEIWGTPYYIAPEKLDKRPEDFRSDIYSLGGTLFHAIAGRPPFEAQNASLVALKHLKSRAVSLQAFAPDVSSETAYVVNRMLEREPENRYQDYDECIAHLRYALDQWRERSSRPRAARERAAMESKGTQTTTGWVAVALIVLVLVGAALAFVFRDRIVRPDRTTDPQALATAGGSDDAAAAALAEARRLLVEGQTASALGALQKLAAQPGVSRPLADWIKLHTGLALLLERDLDGASDWFAPLQRERLFSDDPRKRKLANLFPEVARNLADRRPVAASVVKQYDPAGPEAMALLLFGLKDWQAGEFAAASQLLEAFSEAKIGSDYGWIRDLQPLARPYLDDWRLAGPILARRKAVSDETSRASVQAEAEAALNAIRTGEPLRKALRGK